MNIHPPPPSAYLPLSIVFRPLTVHYLVNPQLIPIQPINHSQIRRIRPQPRVVELWDLGEHKLWWPGLRIQTHRRPAVLAEAVRDPLFAHEVGGCVLDAGDLVVVTLGVGYDVGVLGGGVRLS